MIIRTWVWIARLTRNNSGGFSRYQPDIIEYAFQGWNRYLGSSLLSYLFVNRPRTPQPLATVSLLVFFLQHYSINNVPTTTNYISLPDGLAQSHEPTKTASDILAE